MRRASRKMACQSEPAILPQRYEPKRVPGPASRWSFCRTSSTQMSRSRVTFVTLPATPRPVPSKKRQRFILCNSYRGGFAPLDLAVQGSSRCSSGNLIAAHQRNRAVLLLVVEEERTVRKPTNQVIAPVLLDNPVLSHVGSYQKLGYCINFTVSISSDPSFS